MFVSGVDIYISTKIGKTSEWQKLLSGVLPMVFNYLEKPILNGIQGSLSGSEKFAKAVKIAEQYLNKYVNVDVASADLGAYIQGQFFKWKQDIEIGKVKDKRVFIDGNLLTLGEIV
jgi:hypothetical protein